MAEDKGLDGMKADMDAANLYTEEIITDRKVGTIRVLTPVTTEGRRDAERPMVFVGEAQIMTQMGPLPINFEIEAETVAEAVAKYGEAAKQGVRDTIERIRRAQEKAMAGAPHESILVIDGTNGQNALTQVEAFNAAADLTGLIITKLDGTAKGGVLVAIAQMYPEKPLPIYFIGVGEGIDDLRPFNAHEFASALVGLDPDEPEAAPGGEE